MNEGIEEFNKVMTNAEKIVEVQYNDYDDELFDDEQEDYNDDLEFINGVNKMTKKIISNDEPHFVLAGKGYLVTGSRFATQAEALEEAPKHVKPGYGASEIVVYEAKAVVKADPVPVKTTILMTQSA